ncbi:hypothetical protein D1816_09200 [Aquimarina sp. AD10]|uniref:hypothetical protein n=1 Tax=Aquimarina sp. AD10 TaxID=1714849 RepID=UPI000E533409|nr:hypothetical protein [Aquimarina sp. AD10]AXT60518.1 hypothetical protein D1816_09200 [Aquimarina sp. AD10]RKM97004.1 hypothetical protein D7033_14925 [Aquimarina sp. AD10]
MKKLLKKILFICLSTIFVLACTTNDYEEPENTTAGRAFGITSFDTGRTGQPIDVRITTSVVEFTDLSILANGRTWTFPEGAVDIIGSDNDTTTDLENFSVTFKRAGPVDVVLAPVFENPVPTEVATETFTFNALEQITASISTDLTLVNGAFEVEAGTDVTFTNNSSERDNAEWRVINTTTGKEEDLITTIDLTFPFKALGNYIVGLRAFDDAPFSSSIAAIPVRVIPSSQPVTVEPKIEENDSGQIIIAYSRDLDPATLDAISNFTLLVDGAPAMIQSIMLDPSNPSNLLVIPSTNIKNSQTATIAYNAVNLRSADAAPAPSVSQTTIRTFGGPNLFANGVFEGIDGPVAGGERFYSTGGFLSADGGNNITAAITPGSGVDGSSGLVFSFAAGAGAGNNRTVFGDGLNGDPMGRVVQEIKTLEEATYIVRVSIKYTGAVPGEFKFSMTSFPFNFGGIVNSSITTGFVEGEFVELTTEITPNAGTLSAGGLAYPLINVGGVVGVSEVTIDNIEIFLKEE